MTLKIMLCQGLGKSISNLILGVYGEYFDKPLPQMFTKIMAAYVDVLGSRVKLTKVRGCLSCLQRPCNTCRARYEEL
jgi:hypothetical protein